MAFRPALGLVLLISAAWLAVPRAAADGAEPSNPPAERRQYTFSWQFLPDGDMRPRGGTTRGADVTLDTEPSEAWQRLTGGGLEGRERDRQAILAMAGAYRTSFDFIETMGFDPSYQPSRPYQSWGTEYVYVVAEEPDFVSLQHILVMTFEHDSGSASPPVVVKHWRQDWRYQDRDLHVYRGDGVWKHRHLTAAEAQGTWSQAVYQVDDAPRYEAAGVWQHHPDHSTWTSDPTWRPLPRREFSVRDDYHALAGTNRVTILPTGWVHEEDNLKLVLEGPGEPAPDHPYLAREAGLNRYEHITGHDFSAGDEYWRRTAPFWAEVRAAWASVFSSRERFRLRPQVDGERLFEVMFRMADEFQPGSEMTAFRQRIGAALEAFIE